MAEITNAFVQQFKANLILLAQQKGSRLRPYVRVEDLVGKAAFFDRLAGTTAKKKTSRHGDTPLIASVYSRRRVTPEDWEWADLIDNEDKLRMLVNPESEYALNGAYAIGRALDDAIITASRGNSTAVDADDASSNVALPAGQKVAVSFGGAGDVGLTVEKLIEVKRIFDANDLLDPEEPRVILVGAKQVSDLLNTTEVTNSDYNSVKALVEGKINTFMGLSFVLINRLATSGTTRFVMAWAKSGMGLALNKDIMTRISERSDKSYATQVYACGTFGSVRVEEEKVIEIACAE